MLLPNLFVPGAAKSATSSLHEYLGRHPQIFMSRAKEPHFFSNDSNFGGDGATQLNDYSQLFKEGRECLYRGESSTGYMVFPRVAERIRETVPDPHFIFILRNPIDRAYSHYWWLRGRGYETRSFQDAVLADMRERPYPKNRIKGVGWYRYYFAFGKYGTYLQNFLEVFGKENIFVITTEGLKNDLTKTLNSCFGFLGLENLEKIVPATSNETVIYKHAQLYGLFTTAGSQTRLRTVLKNELPGNMYKKLFKIRAELATLMGKGMKKQTDYPPLALDERNWLALFYREDVQILRKITGLHFDAWTNDFPI